MPRDLFDEVAHPSTHKGSRSRYVLPVSILAHAAAIAVVIIVPLLAADVLPRPSSVMTLIVTPQTMPLVPPPPVSGGESRHGPAHVRAALAPSEAPTAIEPQLAGAAAAPDTGSGVPGGMPGGDIRTILGSLPDVPPPPVVMSTQPWRVGGQIRNPAKTRDVRPIYPPIAVASRVEGRVMIEAIIGADGRVKDATILRSIPLLDQAALAAVRQWQFTPTLLNGVPVPVIMTVTVNFMLQ